MSNNINDNNIVYSTDTDFNKRSFSRIRIEESFPERQDLRVHLLRLKGDKLVTVIRGYKGQNKNLKNLGSFLRKECSVGGTTKKGEIILQGNSRNKVLQLLKDKGHQAKLSGG